MEHQRPFYGTEESFEQGYYPKLSNRKFFLVLHVTFRSGMVLVLNLKNRLSKCLQKGERMRVTKKLRES